MPSVSSGSGHAGKQLTINICDPASHSSSSSRRHRTMPSASSAASMSSRNSLWHAVAYAAAAGLRSSGASGQEGTTSARRRVSRMREDGVVELVEAGAVADGGADVGGHVARTGGQGKVEEEAAGGVQHGVGGHAVVEKLEEAVVPAGGVERVELAGVSSAEGGKVDDGEQSRWCECDGTVGGREDVAGGQGGDAAVAQLPDAQLPLRRA
uniref:Uncharacterized protein n=1 Tax=Oryza meridionalis TaxID=40149 RepID=A0A0E0C6Q2_9ORYZ